MALSVKEKIGAIIAFIPVVSTFSGIIKAFVYYNRVKRSYPNLLEMNILVTKVHQDEVKYLPKK